MELLKEDPISEDRWEAIARLIKGPGSLVSPQSDTPLKIEFYEWENAMFRFLESKQPKNEPIWEILRSFHDKRINIANDFKGLGHFSINIGNARLEAVLESLKDNASRVVSDFKPFLLMDAEMTSIQPAIDLMTNHHARSINTKGSILFGNTYQMYLKESTAKLQHDYHVSKIKDVPLGLKIVRGAYISHEKSEATNRHRPCPIHTNIKGTHKAYDDAIKLVMPLCSTGDMRSVFGTHNEKLIQKICDERS